MLHLAYILKPTLILVALALWSWRRARFGARTALLGGQLVVALLAEAYGGYAAAHGIHNIWMYDLYVPVEFGLLAGYVGAQMKRWWKTKALAVLAVLFVLVYALELRAAMPEQFVSRSYMLSSIILGLAFIAVLYDMSDQVDIPLQRSPRFWAYLGMVAFFLGSIPLLGLWNVITLKAPQSAPRLYAINHVLFTLRYGLIIVAAVIPSRDR